MANVTTPTESTLPVAGGDIIAAPLSGWITNLKNFVEGANIDENNVDYTSFDGIVVKAQTQTLSGAKTFSSAITASAGLITGGVIISDTDSTDDLGSTTKRFANLYVDSIGDTGQDLTIAATTTNLPSGHITDYNSADVTITHAANTLTIAGGNTVVDSLTSGGNIVSDTDSTDDLGTTSVRWANLYVDDITVTNNVAIGGTLSLTGGLTLNGNVTVGDNASDTLTINSTITSNLLFTDNTYDIGASGATRPRDLFLSRNAVMGGTLGVTGLITATGGVSGALTGDVTGNLTGNVTGNVTGNLTGDVTGNISGNVTGGTISGTTATLTGALTGTTGTFASTGTGDILVVETSDDTSTAGPVLCLLRESTSPADGDYLGQIKFKGRNDAGQQLIYAKITAKTSDVTDTTEDSLIEIAVKADGSNRIVSRQKHDCLQLVNGTGLDVNGVTTLEDALNGTTASFSGAVTVNDTIRLDNGDTTISDGDVFGDVEFYDNDGGSASAGVTARIQAVAVGNYGASNILFSTSSSSGGARTALTERVKIASDGDLAVGTDKLFVDVSASAVGVGTSSPAGLGARSLNIKAPASNGADLTLEADNGTNFGVLFSGATTNDPFSIFSNTGFKFATASDKNATGFDEHMRLTSAGSLGINTTSPSQKLDVVGRIRSSYNSGDYFEIGSSDSGGFVLGYSGGVEKINFRTYGDSYFNGGNFGIGTSSPSHTLSLSTTGTDGIKLGVDSQTYYHIVRPNGDGLYLGADDGNTGGSGADIRFAVKGTEIARMLDTGGITFNGDTSTANALDDYEEGTWSPTILGSTSDPTVTYGSRFGYYTKVGNVLHISGYIFVAAGNLSGGAGYIEIGGWPYSVPTGQNNFIPLGYGQANGTVIEDDYTTNTNQPRLQANATTKLQVYGTNNQPTWASTGVWQFSFNGTLRIA